MSELDPVSVAIQQIRRVEPGMTMEYIEGQLSDEQHTVLGALKDRRTMTEAAEAAAVNRSTPYDWLKSDPFFIAAYNAWKAEKQTSNDVRLTNIEDVAIDSLAKAIVNDPKLAYKFLKDRGVMDKSRPGATDPGIVYQQLMAEIQAQSPVAGPRALTDLLTQAGLSPQQQRNLLTQTLRAHHPEPGIGAV